jgi:RNA polymerase sigma-70 factor (ECF subfamily)
MSATAIQRRTLRPSPRTRAATVSVGHKDQTGETGQSGQSADAQLLRTLHDQHARAVWAYVLRLTNGDAARAEDVVQETLLRAWQHPQVLDQSQGSARAWLLTVARRIVIDDWRSRGRRGEVITAEPPERPIADRADHTVDSMIVTAAMNQLSEDHRAVLFECYHRGASVAQAAETLGIPPGTVKSRTHYALRALKTALQDMGGLNEAGGLA